MSKDIRNVKDITDLIDYFSQNLGWSIDIDDFEDIDDISYDFSAEEIGLKEEAFAKISSLKQLQPLVDNQQWGIFCIEFNSAKFEVSALRKILSGLVPRRRNSKDHAVWEQQDLLFICNWGEDNNKTIGIAHFEDREQGLPQIKMISCAPAIEDFTQIKNFEDSLSKLKWPQNTSNIEEWRKNWSSAFSVGYNQIIRDASTLTMQLAAEAQNIRNRVLEIMKVESSYGYVHLLFEKFRYTLIHDLTEHQFADMYAQTVVYGLFSARCMSSQETFSTFKSAINAIPNTNPFLKGILDGCLGMENQILSFDELEVENVIDVLNHAQTDLIIKDFNRQTGGGKEDPVIHFYEDFLTAYDKQQKVQRGVFYTPQPVVDFMVSSVDYILKDKYGYIDGLATSEKRKILFSRNSKTKRNGLFHEVQDSEDSFAVQILDPATGTGTFIRQIILQIYENFKKAHKGLDAISLQKAWNEYVPECLLPRVNAFELMMAPYAVAHMKLAMVLKDTGYEFKDSNRLRIFLTNSLEEPGNSDSQGLLFQDPLATESIEANGVKKNNGINIVIGNPPYSVSSSNKGEWISDLLASYKKDLNEKKTNLDDDYIKFIRYGEYMVNKAGMGILAYISNNSFLDGVTHRQMRLELLQEFDEIYILDLHGSSKKHECCPDGSPDQNVFDIQQGVSINIFIKKTKLPTLATVWHSDLYGRTDHKYNFLRNNDLSSIDWCRLTPTKPYYFFAPKDFSLIEEYKKGFLLTDLFIINNSGIKTDRDPLFIDFDKQKEQDKIKVLLSGNIPDEFKTMYRVENSSSYKLTEKIKGKVFREDYIKPIIYRPYDYRWIYYDPAVISRPGYNTMKHMLYNNWGLYVKRGFEDSDCAPAFCCNQLIGLRAWSRPGSIGSEYLFPLYQYSEEFGKVVYIPNFKDDIVEKFESILHLSMDDERSVTSFTPLNLFDYIYAVIYSRNYYETYREFLKIEFPTIPYPESSKEFFAFADLGEKLRLVHCMIDSQPEDKVIFRGNNHKVEKVEYKDSKVYINKTDYFENVDQKLWNFYVGGYLPLQKWLKDRKEQILSLEDIDFYRRIIYALKSTIKIMKDIDSINRI